MPLKKEVEDKGYTQLKQDLKTGQLCTVYVFHGEETYLREYYLDQLRKKLIPAGFEEMDIADYNNFLEMRRKLMAEKIRNYYFSL